MVGNAGTIRERAELRRKGRIEGTRAASPCFIKILYGRHLFSILFTQFFSCARKFNLCEF